MPELKDLAQGYRDSYALLSARIALLRTELSIASDPDDVFKLTRRIADLSAARKDLRPIAELCERYYDRGYKRHEAFTL